MICSDNSKNVGKNEQKLQRIKCFVLDYNVNGMIGMRFVRFLF